MVFKLFTLDYHKSDNVLRENKSILRHECFFFALKSPAPLEIPVYIHTFL